MELSLSLYLSLSLLTYQYRKKLNSGLVLNIVAMERGCESSLVVVVNGGSSSKIVLSPSRGISSNAEFINVRGAKRLSRSIHGILTKLFVGMLENIKASCEKLNSKHSNFTSSLHGEGGSISKLQEELCKFSEKILCDQAQMQNDIIHIQNSQDKIGGKAAQNI